MAAGGVVSPGGVGFDISCGVRLLATSLSVEQVRSHLDRLMAELAKRVPAGAGGGGIWRLDGGSIERVLRHGARAAVEAGYGTHEDLDRCEDNGEYPVEDVGDVSQRALARGRGQLGSLGSGNHFLEVQVVERVSTPRWLGASACEGDR